MSASKLSPQANETFEQKSEQVLDAAGRALFQLGRAFGRRPLHRALRERAGRPVELSHILVAQAVADEGAASAREITVGAVAEHLAIDPSTASRLVSAAIEAGYLTRAASASDGRRIQLALTEAGRELAEQARRYQRAVFDQVTRAWPEQEQLHFARLFIQFARAVSEAEEGAEAPPTNQ